MKQVLLLDDNAAQLTIRELVLKKAGMESLMATRAQSALELLRGPAGSGIGVVITDHVMPDMDGAEFVRHLRAFNPEMSVIVISGMPDVDTKYDGLDVVFRIKPCDPDDLIDLVKKALNGPECRASA